jgi:hypothetical protein
VPDMAGIAGHVWLVNELPKVQIPRRDKHESKRIASIHLTSSPIMAMIWSCDFLAEKENAIRIS